MTIEKRAETVSPFLADREWYIKGATDQQKIDIEKAKHEFDEFLAYLQESGLATDVEEWREKFYKAMEE